MGFFRTCCHCHYYYMDLHLLLATHPPTLLEGYTHLQSWPPTRPPFWKVTDIFRFLIQEYRAPENCGRAFCPVVCPPTATRWKAANMISCYRILRRAGAFCSRIILTWTSNLPAHPLGRFKTFLSKRERLREAERHSVEIIPKATPSCRVKSLNGPPNYYHSLQNRPAVFFWNLVFWLRKGAA